MAYKKIGELCLQKNLITKKQLEEALDVQSETGLLLSAALIKMGLLTKDQIYELLEEQNRMIKMGEETKQRLTSDIMRKNAVLIFPATNDKPCEDGGICIRLDMTRVSGFQNIESLSVLIKPKEDCGDLPEKFGIDAEALQKEGLEGWEAMRKLREFAGEDPVFTFHAPFTYSFLKPLDHARFLKDNLIGLLTLWRRLNPGPGRGYLTFAALLAKLRLHHVEPFTSDKIIRAMHHMYTEILTEIKVKRSLDSIEKIRELFGRDLDLRDDTDAVLLREIKDAIRDGKDIEIQYHSPWTTETTVRKIKPKELVKQAGKRYLIAFCMLRQAERWFKLERITGIGAEGAPSMNNVQ